MTLERQSRVDMFLEEYLEHLDSFVAHNTLRLYQYIVISGLSLPPLVVDGAIYSFIGSKVGSGLNYLYYKVTSDSKRVRLGRIYLCIISSLVSTAYSVRNGRIQWCTPDEVQHLVVIAAQSKSHAVVLHAGHLNSAHFLWNQLGACLELKRLLPISLSVFQEADTILSLSRVDGFSMVTKAVADQSHSLYAGGLVVTDEARGLVLSSIQPDSPVDSIVSDKKRILLTVRGSRTRSLTNEVDFYCELINRIHQKADCRFILAGFVRQHDYAKMRPMLASYEDDCSDNIRRLMELLPSIRFEVLHNIGIDDFIGACSNLSYYISYEGTMHHRINWLYPHIPSTLITFSGAPPSSVARWHQLNSGKPSAIYYLEQNAYSVEQLSSDPSPRNRRASLVDVASSSENIVQEILRHLPEHE